MYSITPYTRKKAKELNVVIRPSTDPKKKIDVFENGKKYSIGNINYLSYPDHIRIHGKKFADERRRLYNMRHKNESRQGQLASKLLW